MTNLPRCWEWWQYLLVRYVLDPMHCKQKLVREHHEDNMGFERYIESATRYERNKHKARAFIQWMMAEMA